MDELVMPVRVEARPGYHIYLEFADGTNGEVDLSRLVGKGVFRVWNDYPFFENVRLGIIVRSNGTMRSNFAPIRFTWSSRKSHRRIYFRSYNANHPMPELCRFYGIIIRMFWEDHPPPRFQASWKQRSACRYCDC